MRLGSSALAAFNERNSPERSRRAYTHMHMEERAANHRRSSTNLRGCIHSNVYWRLC